MYFVKRPSTKDWCSCRASSESTENLYGNSEPFTSDISKKYCDVKSMQTVDIMLASKLIVITESQCK